MYIELRLYRIHEYRRKEIKYRVLTTMRKRRGKSTGNNYTCYWDKGSSMFTKWTIYHKVLFSCQKVCKLKTRTLTWPTNKEIRDNPTIHESGYLARTKCDLLITMHNLLVNTPLILDCTSKVKLTWSFSSSFKDEYWLQVQFFIPKLLGNNISQ